MSSLQQPTQKRPRLESNNNVSAQNNNCNTSNNLLSLPDEALDNIISYSMPRKESHVWEWIGILNETCRSLRRFAQTYVPTRIILTDFKWYSCLSLSGSKGFDARIGFLESLRDFDWKRQHLKEFHVDPRSVLRKTHTHEWDISASVCNGIKDLLRTLLTTQASFPELEWLDIELQSDAVYGFDLINAETLRLMPAALPALQKLCLAECFKKGIRVISPYKLKRFFNSLQTTLTSLSICGPKWMNDAHIEAIMPIIGENLVRLELVDCVASDYDGYTDAFMETRLSCSSLVSIAQHCKQLKSFSMVDSDITCSGLERVLSANTGITTLNLSDSKRLEPRAVNIISRYLPRVEVLRNYWPSGRPDWFSDDGLISLVNAQEKESGGSGIFLKQIGLWTDVDDRRLTIRGVKYAIEKGVKEIEINKDTLHSEIVNLGSDVQLYQAHYIHYIDGSLYEREPVWKNC